MDKGSAKQKQRFGSTPAKSTSERKNDNVIFFICLVIAALFWGLIKLSEFYTVNYAFNIKYLNPPPEKQLSMLYDSSINVNFRARGFAILKLNLSEDSRILEVDMNEVQLNQQEGDRYFVNTQELRDLLTEIIEIPETDIDFSKSQIAFKLENLYSKEVMVVERHNLQFKTQYDLYEPAVLTPKTVTVYGPKDLLDSITTVYTEQLTLSNLDGDVSVSIGVQNDHPELLHFEPEIVDMLLRVEKFTESSIETSIDFSGLNREVKSFPTTVKVNFKLAQKDFNNVNANQFQVMPETDGLNLASADKIHLKLVRKPDFTRNEWIVPADVEFLIIK